MIAALLGRTGVAAGAPRAHGAPTHPFGLQDPADLAAADGDALGLGGLGQRVQGPMRRLLGIGGLQGAVGLADKPPGRVTAGQGDDLSAVQLPKPRGPAGAGQVAQAVDAVLIEAVQPPVDRSGMAVELDGDPGDLGAVPAQGDDAGALQPAGRRVAGACEPADAAFLDTVGGWSSVERRQHNASSCVTTVRNAIKRPHAPTSDLRNVALGSQPGSPRAKRQASARSSVERAADF